MMDRNAFEYADQCSCLDRAMIGNHFVILSILLRGQADVRTLLSYNRITQYA